jgi:hypothetical protein
MKNTAETQKPALKIKPVLKMVFDNEIAEHNNIVKGILGLSEKEFAECEQRLQRQERQSEGHLDERRGQQANQSHPTVHQK